MRSVMAEVLYNHMTGTSDAMSAGCDPYPLGGKFDETSQVLDEIGLDLPREGSKLVTEQMVADADIVVAFPTPYMPDFVTKDPKTLHWGVSDPYYESGDRLELTRAARDEICHKIGGLIAPQT